MKVDQRQFVCFMPLTFRMSGRGVCWVDVVVDGQ